MARITRPPASTEPQRPLLLSVYVQPRASRTTILREGDGLRIHIIAPPVDGAANEALIDLLAERLKLPKRSLQVVRGATARRKVIAIDGVTAEEFWLRLGL